MTAFSRYVLIAGFLLLIPESILSQKSYYYEKKVYPEKTGSTYFENALKADLFSFAAGDLALLYEHRFSDKFGLEVGAGFLLRPTKLTLMSIFGLQPQEDFKSNAGFSLMLKPRFYAFPWLAGDMTHFPFFRLRQYQHLTAGEIGYGTGYTFFLSKKMFVEISIYGGLLFQWASKGYPLLYVQDLISQNENKSAVLQMNVSFILGFALN